MEAYETSVDRKLAMWAQKTYKEHCMPQAKDYESLNGNLRLILLNRGSKQLSDA